MRFLGQRQRTLLHCTAGSMCFKSAQVPSAPAPSPMEVIWSTLSVLCTHSGSVSQLRNSDLKEPQIFNSWANKPAQPLSQRKTFVLLSWTAKQSIHCSWIRHSLFILALLALCTSWNNCLEQTLAVSLFRRHAEIWEPWVIVSPQ